MITHRSEIHLLFDAHIENAGYSEAIVASTFRFFALQAISRVRASGVLTSNNTQVTAGDTVTIGNKTYTFRAVPAVEGEVDIGADADGSLLNLIRAINHTGTPGVDYVCAAAHTQVAADPTVSGGHTITVRALVGGVAGNSIATTEVAATLGWGATELAGGTEGPGTAKVKIFGSLEPEDPTHWCELDEADSATNELVSFTGIYKFLRLQRDSTNDEVTAILARGEDYGS